MCNVQSNFYIISLFNHQNLSVTALIHFTNEKTEIQRLRIVWTGQYYWEMEEQNSRILHHCLQALESFQPPTFGCTYSMLRYSKCREQRNKENLALSLRLFSQDLQRSFSPNRQFCKQMSDTDHFILYTPRCWYFLNDCACVCAIHEVCVNHIVISITAFYNLPESWVFAFFKFKNLSQV